MRSHHTPITRREQLSRDARIFWRARDLYRLQRFLVELLALFIVLEAITFGTEGRWLHGGLLIGLQLGMAWGHYWLIKVAWRRIRQWWHGCCLLLLCALCLSGCQDMGRGLVKMYGYQGDPFPGACQQEASLKAGQCIPVTQVQQGASKP